MSNYIIDKQKLKEILLMHKTFISQKCQKLMSKGVDVRKLTYKETDKFTDEFIDTMISKLPIDSILDQVDEVMKKTVGYTSKEFMKEKECQAGHKKNSENEINRCDDTE